MTLRKAILAVVIIAAFFASHFLQGTLNRDRETFGDANILDYRECVRSRATGGNHNQVAQCANPLNLLNDGRRQVAIVVNQRAIDVDSN